MAPSLSLFRALSSWSAQAVAPLLSSTFCPYKRQERAFRHDSRDLSVSRYPPGSRKLLRPPFSRTPAPLRDHSFYRLFFLLPPHRLTGAPSRDMDLRLSQVGRDYVARTKIFFNITELPFSRFSIPFPPLANRGLNVVGLFFFLFLQIFPQNLNPSVHGRLSIQSGSRLPLASSPQ